MMNTPKFQELLMKYRNAAAGMAHRDPKKANRSHDKMHEIYKILRATEEGKKSISSLINDKNPYVKIAAASHSLQWDFENAFIALKELSDSGGICSFDAHMVLKQHENGELSFDY